MCSPTPKNEKTSATSNSRPEAVEPDSTSSSSSSCCHMPLNRVAKAIFSSSKKTKAQKVNSLATAAAEASAIVVTDNNENLPPEGIARGRISKKKYTVNKKRTAKQSFDRLKKHVPTLTGKEDVSQLDVLLEAIQYIHALKSDLGQDTGSSTAATEAALQAQLAQLRKETGV